MKKEDLCPGDSRNEWVNAGVHSINWMEAREGKVPTGVKRRRMKCKLCGRRIMSSIRMCDDGCCIFHYIPPHKPRFWWKKGKRK